MPAVQCTRMIACTFAHTPTQAWTEFDFFFQCFAPAQLLQIWVQIQADMLRWTQIQRSYIWSAADMKPFPVPSVLQHWSGIWKKVWRLLHNITFHVFVFCLFCHFAFLSHFIMASSDWLNIVRCYLYFSDNNWSSGRWSLQPFSY